MDGGELKDNSDHLVAYLKGIAVQKTLEGSSDVGESIKLGLEILSEKGLPHLQIEVADLQEKQDKRAGKSITLPLNQIELGISRNKGPMWETEAIIRGFNWSLRGFGDLLPWGPQECELIDDLHGPIVEKNQCLLIHLAAGMVCGDKPAQPDALRKVQKLASSFRSQVYLQGKECLGSLGELPALAPLINVELRAHSHDVCRKTHDKDNRSLLCFPLRELSHTNVGIIALSPSFRIRTHAYLSNEDTKNWIVLLSYRNHMRHAMPPSEEARRQLFLNPTTASFMLGWKTLLAGSQDIALIETKSLERCPHCQWNHIRLPEGIQGSLVGKACIKESQELANYEIQEPWTKETASSYGPEGLKAWELENATPPLGQMPPLKPEQITLLTDLVEMIPTPETPFDQHTWDRIASAGDSLIIGTESLKTAAHAFVSFWRNNRPTTTLTMGGMKTFQGLVDQDLYDKGMELASLGVKAQAHAPPTRFAQEPYPSVRDEPIKTLEHLWPDLLEGRLFLFPEKSEAFTEDLMETKLTFVEQKDKIRYICDPRAEINERTSSRRHPLLTVPTIPSLLRRILYWKRRYPVSPILLGKRDVRSAFNLIPLSVSMFYHAGLRVANYILIYLSLYFGWKGSPGNWGVISTLTMQYIAAHKPKSGRTHGPESFEAFQFVDDGGFVEPALGLRPWLCSHLWERCVSLSLGHNAINVKKRDLEGTFGTRALMWGIIVDTRAETISLPEDKVLKARILLSDTHFDPGMARIPINLIQQLRGKMEFWGSCVMQIRTEFSPVDRMLHSLNGIAFPKGNSLESKASFREFWESLEFLRAVFGSSHSPITPFLSLLSWGFSHYTNNCRSTTPANNWFG